MSGGKPFVDGRDEARSWRVPHEDHEVFGEARQYLRHAHEVLPLWASLCVGWV